MVSGIGETFTRKVNEHLEMGYKLIGQPFAMPMSGEFHQAMEMPNKGGRPKAKA